MNGSHALTLIELLVVVAIIGVLISLLLPAVQKARDEAVVDIYPDHVVLTQDGGYPR